MAKCVDASSQLSLRPSPSSLSHSPVFPVENPGETMMSCFFPPTTSACSLNDVAQTPLIVPANSAQALSSKPVGVLGAASIPVPQASVITTIPSVALREGDQTGLEEGKAERERLREEMTG